jgi:hypothetical protein
LGILGSQLDRVEHSREGHESSPDHIDGPEPLGSSRNIPVDQSRGRLIEVEGDGGRTEVGVTLCGAEVECRGGAGDRRRNRHRYQGQYE